MASTKLEIINAALIRLGDEPISSLSEETPGAKIANAMWNISRTAALRDHPWNFAIAEAHLHSPIYEVEVSSSSVQVPANFVRGDYRYAFQLPSDCLRVLKVYNTMEYKVQGRHIMSNSAMCRIRYVRDVEDEAEFSSSFVDVLAQRLAADFGYALTKSQATADSNYQIYLAKLKQARAVDATEDTTDPMGGAYSSFIAERF